MARTKEYGGRGHLEPRRPIRDNPSHKADLAAAWVVERVVRYRRFAVLLTYLVGAAGRETRELLRDPELMGRVEAGVPLVRERVELPDRFNALLGPHGWVTFEGMDAEVAREAALLAKAGDPEGAEDVLVRHFDAGRLREGVERLCGELPEFEARRVLLLAAIEDHREGRYHASVPVALAQLDGIAHDLANVKFFVKNPVRLVLADTIVGHRSGLAVLAGVMSAHRGQTSASEICVPYRNGIMHGRDLGYANERVSAKSLAALLALGSWVLERARNGRDAEPPFAPFDPDRVGFKDLARAWREAAGTLLRVWFRRSNR